MHPVDTSPPLPFGLIQRINNHYSINWNLTNSFHSRLMYEAAVLFQQIKSRKTFRVPLKYAHKEVNRNG